MMDYRENAGYIITDSCHVGDSEFVLGVHLTAPQQFVTWKCSNRTDYDWGHYFSDLFSAQKDLVARAQEEVQCLEEQRQNTIVPEVPSYSPWGKVQECETLCPGVYSVSTPGHGGIMVRRELAEKIFRKEAMGCAFVKGGYQDKLEELQASHTYDTLEITGSQAVWKEVLAVYAVKTTTDPEGQDVASMDEEKRRLLAEVFWEMNQVSASVETRTETTESEDGAAVETEIIVLVISVSHKSAQEMAEQLGFDADQKEQLQELLSPEYDDLWNELLYGVALGSGNGDLVAVAQSQVGNVGGAPYWSWYGFSSRVEWCAIFVSWCADQCGLLDSGAVPKFSGCGTGVQWFQSRGQWLPGSASPEPGMIIFFKWYGSDSLIADHVGIVERVENGRVYTIEGNSNDMVRRNSYPIGYGEILGYGYT